MEPQLQAIGPAAAVVQHDVVPELWPLQARLQGRAQDICQQLQRLAVDRPAGQGRRMSSHFVPFHSLVAESNPAGQGSCTQKVSCWHCRGFVHLKVSTEQVLSGCDGLIRRQQQVQAHVHDAHFMIATADTCFESAPACTCHLLGWQVRASSGRSSWVSCMAAGISARLLPSGLTTAPRLFKALHATQSGLCNRPHFRCVGKAQDTCLHNFHQFLIWQLWAIVRARRLRIWLQLWLSGSLGCSLPLCGQQGGCSPQRDCCLVAAPARPSKDAGALALLCPTADGAARYEVSITVESLEEGSDSSLTAACTHSCTQLHSTAQGKH